MSVYTRLCPFAEAWAPSLAPLEAYLREPSTAALDEADDEAEAYPDRILNELRARGLPRVLVDEPGEGGARVTLYQIALMSELLARSSAAVAVTAGVTQLAALPYYVAGQLDAAPAQEVLRRIHGGAAASMLLTENDHGSNLRRNQARAERGRLSPSGAFEPLADRTLPATHYRLTGEKHLINGGARHELFTALLRTADDGHLNDFTFFGFPRQPGIVAGERWRTLPIRAADISTVRLEGAVIPAACAIGREGDGFALAMRTLTFARSGPAAAALGLAAHARALAVEHARTRDVYGEPIVRMGAIAEHLVRMAALEVVGAATSIRQIVMMNLLGFAGGHYSAVAKLLCPRLAEEIVDEGRRVLSARAMLRGRPYERIGRDVLLMGIFDGTQHVMLSAVQSQLERTDGGDGDDTLALARRAYATPPRPLRELCRSAGAAAAPPSIARHLHLLAALPGRLPAAPLAAIADALLGLVSTLRSSGRWAADHAARFEAAEIMCGLEGLAGVLELADADRRAALALPPSRGTPGDAEADELAAGVAIGWFGARLASRLGALACATDAAPPPALEGVEHTLLGGQRAARARLRERMALGIDGGRAS